MKKVLLTLVAVIVLVFAGVLAMAAMQPKEYHIERSALTKANPGAVYAVMSDFNKFKEWSPFSKLDPNAKITVQGSPGTVGHDYAWDGNDDAGAGKMTVTSAQPNERVDIRLEFIRPMPGVAQTSWIVKPEGDQTKITWTMDGTNESMMEKVFGMLFMDKMLGSMFDEGLASLGKMAEASSF